MSKQKIFIGMPLYEGKIFADLTSELSHLGKFSFYGSPSFNLKKN